MSALIELYTQVSRQVLEMNKGISDAEKEIAKLSSRYSENVSVRIAKLEEQLKKIDDYLLRIKGFQDLAKKNLDSQNVLTIEAPPGYRVNLNRLRNWAMMIDPTSPNDSYAQRVYIVAKCDECFLKNKQAEFRERICQLQQNQFFDATEEIEALKRTIEAYKAELKQYAMSDAVSSFVQEVVNENNKFWHKTAPTEFKGEKNSAEVIAPGAYAAPFSFDVEQRRWLKSRAGDFYDSEGGRILLPAEISGKQEYVMTITCAPSKRRELDKGLQNFVLKIIDDNPAGTRKVYVLDGVRFNSSSMGSLRELEGTFAIEQIPRNPEQMTTMLEQMMSSYIDLDEVLEQYDSVAEYNDKVDEGKRLPFSTVLLLGWPSSFASRDRELIYKMMTNYTRYGISFIVVSYKADDEKTNDVNMLPEFALNNAIHISMLNRTTITFPDSEPSNFVWYSFLDEISEDYVNSIKAQKIGKNSLGFEYIKRVNMDAAPEYVRGKKSIVLPYGIDSKDKVHSLSFDNENFASYLMGASGSGKSTLLHTLITGILREYHPDDVELWLADFKMSEFAQYIDPLPPHVKYILLDESKELVFDLIDKLTEKMMERQRFFMKHRDMKKVENVPKEIYMPVIFVILDEFSIMSQAVAESEPYKLRLQNLLAKGRALGIKFIFASQTFTKGVAGLTQTAKDQIQTRIAMKNSYSEINETLELSSGSRTEQVKNWMDALPPHFVLLKYRDGDRIHVKRLQVMYFKGEGDEALVPQRDLINRIKSGMKEVSEVDYDASVLNTYVSKSPVIVDGNSYKAYEESRISRLIEEYRTVQSADLSADDVILTFGSPRKMENYKFVTIFNESRENMLLVAKPDEQVCGMSIIMSAIKSFKIQNGKIHIWAYQKNRLYCIYKDSLLAEYEVHEGMSEICKEISSLRKQIESQIVGNDLYVLLGMEQICNDFELIDFGTPGGKSGNATNMNSSLYAATTEEELKAVSRVKALQERFAEEYNIEEFEERWLDEGKSIEEIAAEEELLYKEFLARNGETVPEAYEADLAEAEEETDEKTQEGDITEDKKDMSYNALEDFKYIVKQGSRFGYHFMLFLNRLSDIKLTKLQHELFRHKLAFQVSAEDSATLFESKVATGLPEHVCQYSDTLEQYSIRPFIHGGVTWDGWDVNDKGETFNSMMV